MSQSLGNYVSIAEPFNDMFGKTMSIPDSAMPQWFRLASGLPKDRVDSILADLQAGNLHPGEAKRRLARAVVDRYKKGYGEISEQALNRQFVLREVPPDTPIYHLPPGAPEAELYLPALLADAGLVPSNSEGRRMLAQGAVRINGDKVTDALIWRLRLLSGADDTVISVGKRRFRPGTRIKGIARGGCLSGTRLSRQRLARRPGGSVACFSTRARTVLPGTPPAS